MSERAGSLARPASLLAWLLLPLLLGGIALAGGCRSRSADTDAAGQPNANAGADPAEPGAGDAGALTPMPRTQVTIYYPAAAGEGLVGERHEIFETTTPGDRAKQIVADLIQGPLGKGAVSAIPSGTMLRQVFVLEEQRLAFVDFSIELKEGIGGGSLEELLVVYSIVNSVALNVPQIERVGILINGKPTDTLNGHMDLSRPLKPDRSLILHDATARTPPTPPPHSERNVRAA